MKLNLKYYLILLLFFSKGCLINTFSQNIEIDSLVNYLNTAKEDTNKVKCLHSLFFRYEYNDVPLAEEYINEALTLSKKIDFQRGEAFSYVCLGYLSEDQGKFNEALEWFHTSLKVYKKIDNKKGISRGLRNISSVYMSRGQYAKGLDYSLQALKISEELADRKLIALDYTNIGGIYHGMEDYPKALTYFLKALKMSEETGEKGNVANDLCNIGVAYKEMGDYSKALEYYSKSLEVAKEFNKTKSILAAYSNIGGVYDEQKEYKKALEYYQKAQNIAEEVGDISILSIVLANIGSTNIYLKNYNEAEAVLIKALALTNQTGAISTKKMVHEFLSDLYEETNDFKKAHYHYKEYSNLKDTIFNMEKFEDMTRNELTYEFDKKEAILKAEQEKEAAIAFADKRRQKLFIWLLLSIVIAITIIALVVFRTLKLTRHQKSIIENQKEIVEEKNKEILDSINYAKRIQSAILPSNKVVKEYLKDSFIIYKPKDIVAGDFYWMESVSLRHSGLAPESLKNKSAVIQNEIAGQASNNDIILFAAADCTGHGVPGAMVSVICNNGLNRSVREYGITDPGKILDKTREIVIQEFEKSEDDVKDGMDIALCSLKFEVEKLQNTKNKTVATLQYAGANNPLWIVRPVRHCGIEEPVLNEIEVEYQDKQVAGQASNNDYELIEIKADKQPIGKYAEPEPYITHTIELEKGDTIYIFSDGYADQFGGEKGKKFKASNFKKLILSIQNQSLEQQKETINNTFEDWKGGLEQLDDVCVIGVRL